MRIHLNGWNGKEEEAFDRERWMGKIHPTPRMFDFFQLTAKGGNFACLVHFLAYITEHAEAETKQVKLFFEGEEVIRTIKTRKRDPRVAAINKDASNGRCPICRWHLTEDFGIPLSEELKGVGFSNHHINQIKNGPRYTDPEKDCAYICEKCHSILDYLGWPPEKLKEAWERVHLPNKEPKNE